jgi:hypothetical protein
LVSHPGHSRGQEGGGSTELFAAVSFGRSRFGAPLDRRLFSVEDADSPWAFSDLVEPSPNRVDHLMLSLSLVGTPDQPLCRPMRCPPQPTTILRLPSKLSLRIDLRAEGPCVARPVKVVRAKAREHLPSYREPTSRSSQADQARTFNRERFSAHRFAFSRLVPRVRRCFELPSG